MKKRTLESRVVITTVAIVACILVFGDDFGSAAQKQISPNSKVEASLDPEAIVEAEQRLTDLGYWGGPIDQTFDLASRQALRFPEGGGQNTHWIS